MGRADHAVRAEEGDGRTIGGEDGERDTGDGADRAVSGLAGAFPRSGDLHHFGAVDLPQPRPGSIDDPSAAAFYDAVPPASVRHVALVPAGEPHFCEETPVRIDGSVGAPET
jgi:hypothetical protein